MDTPTLARKLKGMPTRQVRDKSRRLRTATRVPSIIVGIGATAIVALFVFYSRRPEHC